MFGLFGVIFVGRMFSIRCPIDFQGLGTRIASTSFGFFSRSFLFLRELSLQAKQRSAPPKKPRACPSQATAKRGVRASLPAALLPVDATHVAAIPISSFLIPRLLSSPHGPSLP
jgi:hypothetical protein